MSEQKKQGKVLNSSSIFFVSDRNAALDYYARLGFQCDYDFGFIQRDGLELIVHQSQQPGEIKPNYPHHREDALDIFCMADNVDALYEEFQEKGAVFRYVLRVTDYGMKEFAIVDPDGYSIGFGESLE